MSYKLNTNLPYTLTIYPKVPVQVNRVMAWCDEHIGKPKVDWDMSNSPNTVTNVLWFAFKEEKSTTMFALRWK